MPRFALLATLLLSFAAVNASAAFPATAATAWQEITDSFFAPLESNGERLKPGDRKTHGLVIDLGTGDVLVPYYPWTPPVMAVGLYRSSDQGHSWKAVPKCPITGRAECGFSANTPYPYTGRMALLTVDGQGGFTKDGGVTWSSLGKHKRGFDFGDVDWSAQEPKTLFALEHEPWYKCLSTDGGATWTRLDEANDAANKPGRNPRLGVVNASTILLADSRSDGISLSPDLGKTWKAVANYRVLGHHPVHYGSKLYWTTTVGVIVSENGQDWKTLGTEVPNATWGPFFGATESEMIVVSDKGFLLTTDAGKTWTCVAPFPKLPGLPAYDRNTTNLLLAWDSAHNALYAARTAGPAYRLALK